MKALGLPVSEKKNFEVCLLCSLFQNYDSPPPPDRASFDPRGFIPTNLVVVQKRCCIPNIKALYLSDSEKKNLEDGLLRSYLLTCYPRGLANFDPRHIISTYLVEVHKEMLNTKYQSSTPSSFREEYF